MYSRCTLGIAIVFVASGMLRGEDVELKVFTSKEGKFSILLPKDPVTTTMDVETAIGKLKMTTTTKEIGGVHYAVIYSDYPKEKVLKLDADKSLDGARDGALKNTGGKLIQEKKLTLGKAKYPGRELYISIKGGEIWVRQRIYVVGLRMYQTVMAGPEAAVKGKTADKLFGSFELKE